ncbi:MAG: 2-C-methyl-D-erythritol 2,4-cyclodiphosphate synthase [candidate division Zixibacteria bacterium]|nr:2-C-methyl-D-erythritol 2,4-cyclodiphosphate synthase [candidate division Zixibacteria bacterium]
MPAFRVGSGFDVHPFVAGRRLVLGGELIEYPLGLQGHSDADVVLHALCDALLGAVAKGDIGRHFPPSDQQFKDVSSTLLLNRVVEILRSDGWALVNADITIICEQPKIAPYVDKMRANIARVCRIDDDAVSIKATTTERLGFTGREEGIAAMAVALVQR